MRAGRINEGTVNGNVREQIVVIIKCIGQELLCGGASDIYDDNARERQAGIQFVIIA